MLGWATGGLVFGVLGDRIGRAKTMVITILLYSLFTGLSSLSVTFWDFSIYRFLTGLGVGGEFAVGVALVAEVMPARARAYTLGLLQALSAVGNITAALIGITMGKLAEAEIISNTWRPMFVIGAVPAILALIIRRRLKEPEVWEKAAHTGTVARQLGSYRALFSDPRWRRNALVGLALAFSGVIGLWGVGFFTMDLVGNVLREKFVAEGLAEAQVDGRVATWKGITSMMINIGAFIGMFSFSIVTQRIGRKPAFAVSLLAAAVSTAGVFYFLDDFSDIFWMVPIMGICQLSLFAGYAIYFPELFPTYLRSTGTSFCYNVGRYVAAVGLTAPALLTSQVYAHTSEPLRWAGLTMCSIFLVGLVVLPFAPETKGQPLPE
jgi:MFS family permease